MLRTPSAALGLLLLAYSTAGAQTLRGSTGTMERQHEIAVAHDYTFLRSASHVRKFAELGLLVPIRGDANYQLASVSHALGRPALKTFVERLAAQYRSACGEKLVVTSLTRPLSSQPRNASDLSVHPAGMAVDLRASRTGSCRRWLDRTLLQLEKQGVLDATLERFPVHYHIALFPTSYLAYVDQLAGREAVRVAAVETKAATPVTAEAAAEEPPAEEPATVEYTVNRGDTLWSLARRYGVTVEDLKQLNHLATSRIDAGQVITVPASHQ